MSGNNSVHGWKKPRRARRGLVDSSSCSHSGFSLIELMVVIAIMALLVGFAMPAISSRMRASHLTSTAQQTVDQLNFARQTALSRNLPVEVRFYKLPGYLDQTTSTPKVYRAMQLFLLDDTNVTPLVKPLYFSTPVLASTNITESSFMDSSLMPETNGSTAIPTYGANYKYRSFYFRPGGTLKLSGTNQPANPNLFLTLVMENDPSPANGGNFFTIQLDPATGRPRTFRP